MDFSRDLISAGSYWVPLATEVIWKATLVLFAAAGVAWLLRRSSAALRHLVWSIGVIGALAIPVSIALVPSWRIAVLPEAPGAPTPDQRADDFEAKSATPDSRIAESLPLGTPILESTPSPTPSPSPTASINTAPLSLGQILFLTWLFGAVAMLAWMLTGLIAVRLVTRKAAPLVSSEWSQLLEDALLRLGFQRRVRLLEARGNLTPMTFGLWSHVILLPARSEKWSASRKRAVLLHELAHVGRGDVLIQLLAQFTCAVYWFHPLVWYASARLRRERERACDDAVVNAGERPSDYATHLLEVARSYRAAPVLQPAALAMARSSQLEGRLLAVLNAGVNRARVSRSRVAASATAAFAVVLPLSALTPIEKTAAPAASQQQRSGRVIVHPKRTDPLPERWSWAFREAAAANPRRGFWVAYSVRRVDPASRVFISSSSGFNTREFKMTPLQTQLFGTEVPNPQRVDRETQVSHDVALLFQFDRGATDVDQALVTRIHSLRMGIELGGLPVYWLGGASDEQSIAWLRQQFERTTVASIRGELVEAVGIHQSADLAVPFLQRVLREETDERIRAEAAEALGDQGSPQAVQVLRTVVSTDSSTHVRREATEALGQTPDTNATKALIDIILTSSQESIRAQAAEALGNQGTREAAQALEDLIFSDDEVSVLARATEALGDLGGTMGLNVLRRTVLTHPRWQVRAEAAETLGDLPASSALPILEEVIFQDRDQRVQEEAVEALGDLGSAAVPLLRRVIQTHPDREVRSKAIESLGNARDKAGDEYDNSNGTSNSTSNSNSVSAEGRRSEGYEGEPEKLDFKVDQSELISEAEARRSADADAILALRNSLAHVSKGESDLVRERSEWALSLVRNGEVVRPLINALRDSEWRVRAYAGWALAVARDARALTALLAAAEDEHWRVRAHAIYALGEIDAGPVAGDVMIAALEDETWQVRASAAENLGKMGLSKAVTPLRELLTDQHIAVRGAAKQSLQQLAAR